jgi:cobalt/nickel transport system permease protein
MSGAHLLASYRHVDSRVRRAPAAAKLAATLLFVMALALVPGGHVAWNVPGLVLVAVLVRAARVPLIAFVSRVAIAEPFVLGVAVLALFQAGGLPIFAAIVLKSTACVAAVQLLVHTTAFPEILSALARAGLPRSLIWTLALLHRYLFVLVDETRRMQRARAARTSRGGRIASWKGQASVVAVSFVRSVTRAERIYAAMLARGWS